MIEILWESEDAGFAVLGDVAEVAVRVGAGARGGGGAHAVRRRGRRQVLVHRCYHGRCRRARQMNNCVARFVDRPVIGLEVSGSVDAAADAI